MIHFELLKEALRQLKISNLESGALTDRFTIGGTFNKEQVKALDGHHLFV